MSSILAALALALSAAPPAAPPAPSTAAFPPPARALAPAAERARRALVARHGERERPRVERGVAQVAAFWTPADGDARAFQAFCEAQFLPAGADLDATFARLEAAFEALDGHHAELDRELSRWAQLDVGPELPVDGLLDALDPAAHAGDELFASKAGFAVLLNFPLTTLDERLARGEGWSRRQWAEVRLAARFARRVPAAVNVAAAEAAARADAYVARYDLHVHHLLSERGERLFPQGKRLLAHWNLRDELRAQYAAPGGLERQRALARAMERIVTQTIPAAVIGSAAVDWNPFTNEVRAAPAGTVEAGTVEAGAAGGRPDPAREPDTRYAAILAQFRAARAADPYSPAAPTFVARTFELQGQLPEARVVALLEEVLGSRELRAAGRLVAARLGRPLQPFDVWYPGFRPRAARPEDELDRLTRARYPSAEAFARALPETLQRLGFSPEKARWLADRVEVDPARGSGHAFPARRRGDKPRLRTRVGPDGLDYKGFHIAIHELGHNVEQVFSLHGVDHTLLAGVPSSAFTEGIAFVFQARDLDVLGLEPPEAEAARLRALDDLWRCAELAAVGLVDLGMWRWLYAHPRAGPAELREATLGVAREVWNRWWAPIVGVRDSPILAVYSHLVNAPLYLPSYPVGQLVAAQLEEHLAARPAGTSLGDELERMTTFGALTPDLWMRNATGAPLSAAPLLRAAARALEGR